MILLARFLSCHRRWLPATLSWIHLLVISWTTLHVVETICLVFYLIINLIIECYENDDPNSVYEIPDCMVAHTMVPSLFGAATCCQSKGIKCNDDLRITELYVLICLTNISDLSIQFRMLCRFQSLSEILLSLLAFSSTFCRILKEVW